MKKEDITEKLNDNIDISKLPTDIKLRNKYDFRCIRHNISYQQNIRSTLSGINGCHECIFENITGKSKSEYIEIFINDSNKKHNNLYDYKNVAQTFINAKKDVSIICNKHGEFYQTMSNHRKGNGCPKCSIKQKFSNSLKTKALKSGLSLKEYQRIAKRKQSNPEVSNDNLIREVYENKRELVLKREIWINDIPYPNLTEAVRKLDPKASITTIARLLESGVKPEAAFDHIVNYGIEKGIIYLYTCPHTDMKYIGQTITTLETRINGHYETARQMLNAGKIKNNSIQSSLCQSLNKPNLSNWIIIEENLSAVGGTDSELSKKERYYIKQFNTKFPNGLNQTSGGESGTGKRKETNHDNQIFKSQRETIEYIAATKEITIDAAKKRYQTGRISLEKDNYREMIINNGEFFSTKNGAARKLANHLGMSVSGACKKINRSIDNSTFIIKLPK